MPTSRSFAAVPRCRGLGAGRAGTDAKKKSLRAGDIVAMDDLSSHKRAGVRTAIEAVGTELRLRSAYGADLDPIEKAFGKLEAKLRAAHERTTPALKKYLGEVIDRVTPNEGENDFVSGGYSPAISDREPL